MNPYVQYMYSYPHKTAYRPLQGISLEHYIHFLKGSGNGLYLHIPFCQAKCGYCNLFSVTGQGEVDAARYLDAVKRQCMQYEGLLETVQAEFGELAIGGGTPLCLAVNQLEQMFGMLERHFRYSRQREVVIETAPNQTDAPKLGVLKQAGVTRVSMGIQSFHDSELRSLGRQHQAKQARKALHLLKEAEFACVNVDFIYGIPGQTVESLLASLQEALTFEPDEIFLYPLYINRGAWLKQRGDVWDQSGAYLQYQQASAFLKDAGYRQDSMRRFVRSPQKRAYSECGFGTLLALGCGGRSYLGNLHFSSPYATQQAQCLARLEEYEQTQDYTKITHGFLLSEEEMKRRYVIRHLLIMPGLSLERYQEAFGSGAVEDFPVLQTWLDRGFVEQKVQEGGDTFLALTQEGLGLSDYLGPMLISPQVLAAMEAWE
ncbi:MAG: STM4012 family radical SAM protein [Eubacterium sp.]|nr:STM4012 family radical SAM protein [Eubacterium sp.]